MTGVTSWVGMACVTGTAAIPPPAAHLTGLVGGTVGGPVPGAWIAAVLVALAAAVLLLPARRDLPRGWTTGTPEAQALPTYRGTRTEPRPAAHRGRQPPARRRDPAAGLDARLPACRPHRGLRA